MWREYSSGSIISSALCFFAVIDSLQLLQHCLLQGRYRLVKGNCHANWRPIILQCSKQLPAFPLPFVSLFTHWPTNQPMKGLPLTAFHFGFVAVGSLEGSGDEGFCEGFPPFVSVFFLVWLCWFGNTEPHYVLIVLVVILIGTELMGNFAFCLCICGNN